MVGLDAVLGLKDVRVYGALAKELDALELAGFFCKYVYENAAYDLALGFRICYASKGIQEAVHCVYVDEVEVELLSENFADLLRLSLAEEAVVNVHAGEALAYSLGYERCANGGIYAAGKGKQHLAVRAYLLVDLCKLLFYEGVCELRSGDPFHGFWSYI